MKVDIRNLSKAFGATRVLKEVSLDIREGELCALLGPSGSGKTTLLRIIAGLDFPDQGAVLFDGEDVVDRSARDRKVGLVFQHYALFRHMTVFENIAFGLNIRPRRTRPAPAEIRRRVSELLELVQLGEYGPRFPDQLSGGQRQRVALARALAIEPRILLLDEPFGALDARVRKEMRKWLRELQQKIRLTSVFVTHDQDEALELADRVAVMEQGELVQVGSPQDVYDHPGSPFVYDFLGGANRMDCRISGGRVLVGDDPVGQAEAADDDAATLYVRAHDFELLPAGRDVGLQGVVAQVGLTGGLAHLDVRLAGGQVIEVQLPRWALGPGIVHGQQVRLLPRHFGVFGSRGAAPAVPAAATDAGRVVNAPLQRAEAAVRS